MCLAGAASWDVRLAKLQTAPAFLHHSDLSSISLPENPCGSNTRASFGEFLNQAFSGKPGSGQPDSGQGAAAGARVDFWGRLSSTDTAPSTELALRGSKLSGGSSATTSQLWANQLPSQNIDTMNVASVPKASNSAGECCCTSIHFHYIWSGSCATSAGAYMDLRQLCRTEGFH